MSCGHRRQSPELVARRAESDRLRPLFLALTGHRDTTAVLVEHGIPTAHGTSWISGNVILDPRWQAIVREALAAAGIAPSPCA